MSLTVNLVHSYITQCLQARNPSGLGNKSFKTPSLRQTRLDDLYPQTQFLLYLANLATDLTLASNWWVYNTAIEANAVKTPGSSQRAEGGGGSIAVVFFSRLLKAATEWLVKDALIVDPHPMVGLYKKRYSTLGWSRWWGPSVCSSLASHFVRTTSAHTPSSSVNTWRYECCFGPKKSSYRISTPPSRSLLS